jgi:hypothetical protein
MVGQIDARNLMEASIANLGEYGFAKDTTLKRSN